MTSPNTSDAPDCDFSDPQSVNRVMMRTDITVAESQALYKKWAETGKENKDMDYDENISKDTKYGALKEVTTAVLDVLVDKSSLVLDVGAGTGLTGKLLHDLGYSHLEALEPLAEFCDVLQSKGLYSRILQEFIGGGSTVSVADDTYDAIVTSGAMGPGHIPADAMHEMVRIVKPGGHVIIVMREEYLRTVDDYHGLEGMWQDLVTQGKWTLVKRWMYPNHFAGKDGLVVIYRLC